MEILHTIEELRSRLAGETQTAAVLTLGNLHEGHLSLVREAARHGSPVLASVFLNRMQFAPHEDFDSYPRTLDADMALLRGTPCDILFAPDEREIYPEPQGFKVVPPPALADILEGASRPGFFTGVATVVLKFFEIIRPALSVFGRKDYQQVLVIESMCRQLALPIRIVRAPTVRAADGLALSSRNGFLRDAERLEATHLHRVLQVIAQGVAAGADASALEAAASAELNARGWAVDYLVARNARDLGPLRSRQGGDSVVLGAARLGATRLIDNVDIKGGA